jgi:hypothetical protein
MAASQRVCRPLFMVTNMTHWHEHPVKSGGWVFRSPQPSRVTPVFRGQDVRKAPFEGYFMRYEGETLLPNGRPPNWHKHPDGWFELRPHELLLAWSSQEAKEKFTPLLPLVEDGKHDNLFDRRPYEPRWSGSLSIPPVLRKHVSASILTAAIGYYTRSMLPTAGICRS